MALEMRNVCERCGDSLSPAGEAYICSFECTFCSRCAREMKLVCPNCGGELVRRPSRKASAITDDSTAAQTAADSSAAQCPVSS